jgi:hypothetical protein
MRIFHGRQWLRDGGHMMTSRRRKRPPVLAPPEAEELTAWTSNAALTPVR